MSRSCESRLLKKAIDSRIKSFVHFVNIQKNEKQSDDSVSFFSSDDNSDTGNVVAPEECKKLLKRYETGDSETTDSDSETTDLETEKLRKYRYSKKRLSDFENNSRRRKYSKKRLSDYEYDSNSRKATRPNYADHNSNNEIIQVGTNNKKKKTAGVTLSVPTKRLHRSVESLATLITSVHEDNKRFQERLDVRLTSMQKRLKNIERCLSNDVHPRETSTVYQSAILPSFPLSHESLNQFDDSLSLNKGIRNNMIQWITYRSGSNAQEACKNVFRDFFASDIGMFGCWSGKGHNGKQKISLCNLELVNLLEEVLLKKQFNFSRSMISECFRKEIRKSYDKTLKMRKKTKEEEIVNQQEYNEDSEYQTTY